MLSLWLVPYGDVRGEIARLIARLAARWGTPVFDPHITLVGGLGAAEGDIVRRAAQIAARIGPVPMRLARAGWEEPYFRCFYLVVDGDGVVAARRVATEVFGAEPADYFPHLSLAYGDPSVAEKERVRAEVERRLPIDFDARTLEVWRTTGDVPSWRKIAGFDVGSRAG